MEDDIEKSLGTMPSDDLEEDDNKNLPSKPQSYSPILETNNEEDDFEFARQNYHLAIERGIDAMEEMLMIAKQDQNARSFEVVSTLINTITNANKDLVKMGENRVKAKENKSEGANVTNNNLFVGSTSELQQALAAMRKDDSEDE